MNVGHDLQDVWKETQKNKKNVFFITIFGYFVVVDTCLISLLEHKMEFKLHLSHKKCLFTTKKY